MLAGSLWAAGSLTAQADENTAIAGAVTHERTGERVADAVVLLQCACLPSTRETRTNGEGLYAFRNLPAGVYTIQVLTGQAEVTKIVDLPRGTSYRAGFVVDPNDSFRRRIVVEERAIRADTTTSTTLDVSRMKDIPTGGTGRDFTDVVDVAPTAGRDAAGIRLAGTAGDESKYEVDGANVTSPTFGTVGATIVQEFISTVEVKEAGYDAEYGGASGGIVAARRVSGSNKLRGQVVMRYTPRLAAPRRISRTDSAVRSTVVNNHRADAVVVVTGPIIKDRLFFSFGVSPGGDVNQLLQGFYHRVDKDGSGGFAGCAYDPGANDCVDDETYIQTERFAEQQFRTGSFRVSYSGRLDWVVNPKHQLSLSGGGGPRFDRTNYRQASGSTPSTFGANPATLLGGATGVSSGIVNDHFGTTFSNSTQVGVNYLGRVARDSLEIDAGLSFFQARFQQAWRLDNPALRDQTLTQESDAQGRNLYEFLDRDGAIRLVPGVGEACNRADLGGLVCPTRSWLSGGIGQYNHERSRRYEGRVSLTHFFNIARTNHQLKYGTSVEHIARDLISAYSGANRADFYENCDGIGGGEYCYDPETDTYTINPQTRVNNNRLIRVDSDNPDVRTTIGYGRTREEQHDLRALATPVGGGVRVPSYSAVLGTQNYAVFLQDRMQLLSNFYLSGGVRWEIQDMRDLNGERAVFIWDNVAPRFGLTYDWTGEGKSRLFASYGWFYRPLPLTLNSRVFGGLVNVFRTYRAQDCRGTVTIDGQDQAKSVLGQPTEYCTDYNVSTTGLTNGTVVPRLRGQFNRQFQAGYDQEIVEDLLVGVTWLHNSLGRAVEDVSTNGGNNFIIANPGHDVAPDDIAIQQAQCDDLQTQLDALDPDDESRTQLSREFSRCQFLVDAFTRVGRMFDRPIRNYDAWTFRVQKRLAKNWILLASYTYSRLIGNYDGSVDRNSGSINLGASSQYDLPELVRNSFGPLFNDLPHQIKFDGYYQFDLREAGRLTLGSSIRFQSGVPVSLLGNHSMYGASIYLLPRGAGGRTPPVYNVNLSLGYAYPLPRELELEVSGRLVNLTNAKAILRVSETYTSSNTRAVAGGDFKDLLHVRIQDPGQPTSFYQRTLVPKHGNFGVETSFQQPISAQFEVRLRF